MTCSSSSSARSWFPPRSSSTHGLPFALPGPGAISPFPVVVAHMGALRLPLPVRFPLRSARCVGRTHRSHRPPRGCGSPRFRGHPCARAAFTHPAEGCWILPIFDPAAVAFAAVGSGSALGKCPFRGWLHAARSPAHLRIATDITAVAQGSLPAARARLPDGTCTRWMT